jgi:hypothetical protein
MALLQPLPNNVNFGSGVEELTVFGFGCTDQNVLT